MSPDSPLWKDPLVQGTLMQLVTPHAWKQYSSVVDILEKTKALDAESLTAVLLAAEENEDYMSLTASLYPEKAAGMIKTWDDFGAYMDPSALFLKESDGPLKAMMAMLIDEVVSSPELTDIADSIGTTMLNLGLQAKTDGYTLKLPPKLVDVYCTAMRLVATDVTNPNIKKNLEEVSQLMMSDIKKFIHPVIMPAGKPAFPSINLN